jgi:hypothetical protein
MALVRSSNLGRPSRSAILGSDAELKGGYPPGAGISSGVERWVKRLGRAVMRQFEPSVVAQLSVTGDDAVPAGRDRGLSLGTKAREVAAQDDSSLPKHNFEYRADVVGVSDEILDRGVLPEPLTKPTEVRGASGDAHLSGRERERDTVAKSEERAGVIGDMAIDRVDGLQNRTGLLVFAGDEPTGLAQLLVDAYQGRFCGDTREADSAGLFLCHQARHAARVIEVRVRPHEALDVVVIASTVPLEQLAQWVLLTCLAAVDEHPAASGECHGDAFAGARAGDEHGQAVLGEPRKF